MEQFRDKVELYGVVMEKMGLAPVAARVYVYLLFAAEPGATFEDLVNYFKVSKSAVSNALKMLNSTGMVDTKTISGQRKRYFFVDFKNTFNETSMSEKFQIMSGMLDDIRTTRNIDDELANELDHASLLYDMLIVELPIILERWKRTIKLNQKNR